MKCKDWGLLASVGFAAALLYAPSPAWAQSLGAAQSFAILGGSAVNANGTGSVINGDVGIDPTALSGITGFPASATVLPPFTIVGPPASAPARAATTTLFNSAELAPAGGVAITANLSTGGPSANGHYTPGKYSLASGTAILPTTMTLDGAGIYIFSLNSDLTTSVGSTVILNGVDPCTVFWRVPTLATLNGLTFPGTVVAGTGVHLGVNASLTGRALVAAAGDVTMAGTNTVGGCSAPLAPPTLGKAFSPTAISAGGVSTLTITMSNPNTSVATLSADFTDFLPNGVVVAPTPNASTTCGGGTTVTAVAGTTTVTLPAGRTIPAAGSCTVTVNVTAPSAGSFINALAANALQTTNGNNAAPAAATLTVSAPVPAPPTLGKAFSPFTIIAGGVSTLTITLINTNNSVATLTQAFTDSLPSGVVVAPTPNASTTCGGSGAVIAVAGTTTVTLPAGRTIPAAGTCTVTVNVTAPSAGSFINALAANTLQTTNGNNANLVLATLTVNPDVNIARVIKGFSAATINAGGESTLIITLFNPNTSLATLTQPFIDTLPSGMVIHPTPNAGTTCPGSGEVIALAGGTTVTLPVGRAIPAAVGTTPGSCLLIVHVTAPFEGSFTNIVGVNALQTSIGNNAAPAAATLSVIGTTTLPPPTIPTTGEWGMMIFAAALLGFMAWMIQAKRTIK